uniref:F-box/LRR-repeat protein At5g54820 n=1 Tax=Elaeis guineensis var. tenera TaxID=51953 RepID=A0A6I9QGR2_ELAGV|nr:putative F-box/LRR-repeat protein At5g54820 [Elaeis guineensis]
MTTHFKKNQKHPDGRCNTGGMHHHRILSDKYHPGYFGKLREERKGKRLAEEEKRKAAITMESELSSLSGPLHNLLCSPYIELDESCFDKVRAKHLLTLVGCCVDTDLVACMERGGRAAFIAYARWFMDHYHGQKVTHLRLHLSLSDPSQYNDDVKNLIYWAVSRGAEELDLDFANVGHRYTGFAELPCDFLYRHKSPHILRISGCNFEPAGFRFTELRKLSIENVQVNPNTSVELLTCESLEDLALKVVDDPTSFHIVDPNRMLKRVTIEGCLSGRTGTASIRIEAPCLKYFKYSGFVMPIIVEGCPPLDEAELDFNLEYAFYRHGNLISEILFHLQNTRVLTVCSYVTQVIPFGLGILHRPMVIAQLRHLVLKNTMLHVNEAAGIVFLLNCFIMLETLTIEMGYREQLTAIWLADEEYCRPSLDVKTSWESQVSPIVCLERHLKNVCIKNFRGHENEVHFLLFLLKKSRRIEELSVGIANETKQDWENYETYALAARQLQQCDKASPGLKIRIS